jgi:MFS family permease
MTVRKLTPHLQANFSHLYADIVGFGVLSGATLAFLAVYLTRLGAGSFELGLLNAGPAVVNLMFSLPFGNWLQGRPLTRAAFWGAVLQRMGYTLMVPLPWLLVAGGQMWAVIVITLVMAIPGTVLAISFNSLFASVVPPEWRADIVGRRNAAAAIATMLTTLIAGYLLDHIAFPFNYGVVFAIGAAGAAFSSYHVGRLSYPAASPAIRDTGGGPARRARSARRWLRLALGTFMAQIRRIRPGRGGSGLRVDLLRGPFGPFMFAYLAFYIFQYTGLPIFPQQMVRGLNLTDGQISLGTSLFYLAMLIVSLNLSWISARFGHRRVLAGGALVFSIYPLLLSVAAGPTLYYVDSLLGGGVWAMLSAGLINRLMERVPDDDRSPYMAIHNLALNLGILGGSLAASGLVAGLGLNGSLLATAGLRFLAGLLLWIWG